MFAWISAERYPANSESIHRAPQASASHAWVRTMLRPALCSSATRYSAHKPQSSRSADRGSRPAPAIAVRKVSTTSASGTMGWGSGNKLPWTMSEHNRNRPVESSRAGALGGWCPMLERHRARETAVAMTASHSHRPRILILYRIARDACAPGPPMQLQSCADPAATALHCRRRFPEMSELDDEPAQIGQLRAATCRQCGHPISLRAALCRRCPADVRCPSVPLRSAWHLP